jgi:hypothetical protein
MCKQARDRCYDHHFLRFFSIFSEEVDKNLRNRFFSSKLPFWLIQKRQFVAEFFCEKKNHNIGPR